MLVGLFDKFLEFIERKFISFHRLLVPREEPEYHDLETLWNSRKKRKNPPEYSDLEKVVKNIVEQEVNEQMRNYREEYSNQGIKEANEKITILQRELRIGNKKLDQANKDRKRAKRMGILLSIGTFILGLLIRFIVD